MCKKGWTGESCTEMDEAIQRCLPDCSGRGVFNIEKGVCQCEQGFSGKDCSQRVCKLDCNRGRCLDNHCVCPPDYHGERCELKKCDVRCASPRGQCNNGTCLCVNGFNGKHCTLDGCPFKCSGHGQCRVSDDQWRLWKCECEDGWTGKACEVRLETRCGDGYDNDRGERFAAVLLRIGILFYV